jgi:phage gpG-like protein
MVTRYEVDPDQQFAKAVAKAIKEVDDLTIPFTLITKSWFQSNKAIFALKGPGKYTDLSEVYKDEKQNAVGFVYPILKRSGALARSITQPGGDSIAKIINKTTLVLGSKDKKAAFHQKGMGNLPIRPVVMIGAEQTAPPELNQRRALWIKTIVDYVAQKTEPVGGLK